LKVYDALFNLKNKGITLIYVSHKLDEVFKLCDSATILRDGKFINSVKISDITERELIKLMVGRDVSAFAVRQRPQLQTKEVVLEVENLTKTGVFNDISFHLKKGEILGLSGLVGSKRTDVVRALFGADHYDEGTIKINGHSVKINSCMDGLKAGIGLIPEDRKRQGFLKNFNNSDNIAITTVPKFSKNGLINEKLKLENAQHFIDKLNLNPKNAEYLTKDLSGGNQQKVVLAKWLSSDVDIIILDEPTKGVDIGAKYEIYKILEELVMNGKSIIMVSSELPEIIGLCDRVIVMREGLIMKELVNENLDEEILLQYAMGVNENVS
jgi:ribose transport system ATP-binding protein